MPGLFKFIEPEFAQGAIQFGAFRLGTFDEYRKLDEADGIGDSNEGVSVGRLHGTIDGLPEADRIRILRDSGFGGSDEALARMRDVTFVQSGRRLRAPPAYVFCLSMSIDAKGIPESKSAIVQVTDLEGFMSALVHAHPDRLTGVAMHGAVIYADETHDIIAARFPPPDPFKKRKKYQGQTEYRIVFDPVGAPDPFVTNAPEAANFVRRIR